MTVIYKIRNVQQQNPQFTIPQRSVQRTKSQNQNHEEPEGK